MRRFKFLLVLALGMLVVSQSEASKWIAFDLAV